MTFQNNECFCMCLIQRPITCRISPTIFNRLLSSIHEVCFDELPSNGMTFHDVLTVVLFDSEINIPDNFSQGPVAAILVHITGGDQTDGLVLCA